LIGEPYIGNVILLMVLEHNAMQQHDSCKTCKYVMGGDSAHRQLHCGLSYYQAPAAERKASKLIMLPSEY